MKKSLITSILGAISLVVVATAYELYPYNSDGVSTVFFKACNSKNGIKGINKCPASDVVYKKRTFTVKPKKNRVEIAGLMGHVDDSKCKVKNANNWSCAFEFSGQKLNMDDGYYVQYYQNRLTGKGISKIDYLLHSAFTSDKK